MTTEKNTNMLKTEHKLCLDERKDLTISGVYRVDAFSDKEIVLITNMGKLTIKGDNLHVEKLNVETGDFSASGKVISMAYSKSSANKGSFIERVFK